MTFQALSLLPPNILSLLEWIGFSSNKDKGLEQLRQCYVEKNLRSPIVSLFILSYQLYLTVHLGTYCTFVLYLDSCHFGILYNSSCVRCLYYVVLHLLQRRGFLKWNLLSVSISTDTPNATNNEFLSLNFQAYGFGLEHFCKILTENCRQILFHERLVVTAFILYFLMARHDFDS